MKTVTMKEFHQTLRAQGQPRREDLTFKCPRCGTVQSAQDLIDAGAGEDMDAVEKYTGFSCVGRWSDTKGCNWTLGGLLQIHEYEVVDDDGVHHPLFEPVMPAEGAAHG